MSNFIIDVPVPSMGATVSELTIVTIVVAAGAKVTKGQKLAELESDKSSFDFESPVDGTILGINGQPGEVKSSGQPLFRMETSDPSVAHLQVESAGVENQTSSAGDHPRSTASHGVIWPPRALKLAQEAGLDPANITTIEATGPGGRVSGDDVVKYLAKR
jgi:pyruvate/2-oxoglutarate dehydrogenase complex dihydrolipoamide acyltransferase (E2) component